MTWPENLYTATGAWREFCRALETTGVDALAKTMTKDEIDLAEGLRYLTRIAGLAAFSSMENLDSAHPYLWAALDPHRKMGGDNPQGLYLQAPINGTDTYRLRGDRGSARWVSIIVSQDGLDRFGEALFLPDFEFDDDGKLRGHDFPHAQSGELAEKLRDHQRHSHSTVLRQCERCHADGIDHRKPHR